LLSVAQGETPADWWVGPWGEGGRVYLVPRAFPLKVGGAGPADARAFSRPTHLQGKSPGNEVEEEY